MKEKCMFVRCNFIVLNFFFFRNIINITSSPLQHLTIINSNLMREGLHVFMSVDIVPKPTRLYNIS